MQNICDSPHTILECLNQQMRSIRKIIVDMINHLDVVDLVNQLDMRICKDTDTAPHALAILAAPSNTPLRRHQQRHRATAPVV